MKRLIPFILIAIMSYGGSLMAQETIVPNISTSNAASAQPAGLIERSATEKSGMTNAMSAVDEQATQTDSTLSPAGDPVVIYIGSGLTLVLIIILLIILL